MSELKNEISKNIQLVFDNEKLFLEVFISDYKDAEVESFYMGGASHLVKFSNGWGDVMDRCINTNEFDNWKSTLDNRVSKS